MNRQIDKQKDKQNIICYVYFLFCIDINQLLFNLTLNYVTSFKLNHNTLQTWMRTPSIYVYDCNNAGIIVESFKTFADQHEREYAEQLRNIKANGGNPADIPNPTALK